MSRIGFWLRWTGRDLRRRWVQVAITALVIAIGTGAYAGLLSLNSWQSLSLDASYLELNAHDLRLTLPESGFIEQGKLAGVLEEPGLVPLVAAAEERLVVPAQIDASRVADGVVLVPGRIVAMPDPGEGRQIDDIYLTGGSGLDEGAVLEGHFAAHYGLPPEGTVELPGGVQVDYTGTGFTPEFFVVTTGRGDFMAEANFAVLFMRLDDARELLGLPGQVNDMVVKLQPGVDRREASAMVQQAVDRALPRSGVTVASIEEDDAYMMMYEDAQADRTTFSVMALLILVAAAFAAFNLISRMVEAQRREIGVGMALGASPALIGLRPLLVGAEIAALGVLFGLGTGFWIAAMLRSVFMSMVPLPVWLTPLQAGYFLTGAATGFIIPFAAAVWPVWRAVRVDPVDAIRTGHLASRGGGLAPLLKRLHLPGNSLRQMPWRNLLRAPRRTAFTVLGIGAALVVMVAVLGVIDSLNAIVDRGTAEVEHSAPDRLEVILGGFEPLDSRVVAAVESAGETGMAEPVVRLTARAGGARGELDLQLVLLDFSSRIWHPTIMDEQPPAPLPPLVLSAMAADDIGASPGDVVTVRHPYLAGDGTVAVRDSPMQLAGVHPGPIRFLAYGDIAGARGLGLGGVTNGLQVTPAAGTLPGELKHALFNLPGVAVVEEPGAALRLTGELLEEFSSIMMVFALFALMLVLLIALNVASINADERVRENATMAAYGIRIRTMLGMSVVELALIGFMGTILGLALGFAALKGLLAINQSAMPELQMITRISPKTILLTIVMGIGVSALAPVFGIARLRRMNIPSTLRVME